MLVCPQCEFENPDTNKFCQQCGASLTHQKCPECGSSVDWSAKNCHNCGAFTGIIRWAIVAQPSTTEEENQENTQPEALVPEAAVEEKLKEDELTSSPLSLEKENSVTEPEVASDIEAEEQDTYIDLQKRYQQIPPVADWGGDLADIKLSSFQVLDRQPLRKSFIEVLVEQQGNIFEPEEPEKQEYLFPDSKYLKNLVEPYLVLQESFANLVPQVYDAWQQGEKSIVLLEDRSEWEYLITLWGQEEVGTLQILYWFDEMAKLWVKLEQLGCRQSLLEEDNLRLDEDQSLCLQQLYPTPKNKELKLKDLAIVWQLLFSQSQRTQYGPLLQLLDELTREKIESVEELRSSLQKLAYEQQQTEEDIAEVAAEEDSELMMEDPISDDDNEKIYASGEGDDLPTVVLPMQLLSLMDAGYTDIGRQRQHNEDYFGIQTTIKKQESALGKNVQGRGLYIVCDGMGGHAAGEVASAMAVENLQRYFQLNWKDELPSKEIIREGILAANQAIYDVNQQNARSGSGRMGTTLVMALVQDTNIMIAHVGDSRIYVYTRKRGLEQITVDHEVGQREIQRGVDPTVAYARADAYQLTQALGPRSNNFINPDIQAMEVNEDTMLILCSDGLSDGNLLETNSQTYLHPLMSSSANLEQGLNKLTEFANRQNGHDNITAILVRLKVRPNQQSLGIPQI